MKPRAAGAGDGLGAGELVLRGVLDGDAIVRAGKGSCVRGLVLVLVAGLETRGGLLDIGADGAGCAVGGVGCSDEGGWSGSGGEGCWSAADGSKSCGCGAGEGHCGGCWYVFIGGVNRWGKNKELVYQLCRVCR